MLLTAQDGQNPWSLEKETPLDGMREAKDATLTSNILLFLN